ACAGSRNWTRRLPRRRRTRFAAGAAPFVSSLTRRATSPGRASRWGKRTKPAAISPPPFGGGGPRRGGGGLTQAPKPPAPSLLQEPGRRQGGDDLALFRIRIVHRPADDVEDHRRPRAQIVSRPGGEARAVR